MADSRPHSPITGSGTETRGKPSGGEMPGNVRASWPGKASFQPSHVAHRRKAVPQHPGCTTDTMPHRTLTNWWRRNGYTKVMAAEFVRTKLVEGDALGERALAIYLKNRLVEDGDPVATFPMTRNDRLVDTKATHIGYLLEQLDDTEIEDVDYE